MDIQYLALAGLAVFVAWYMTRPWLSYKYTVYYEGNYDDDKSSGNRIVDYESDDLLGKYDFERVKIEEQEPRFLQANEFLSDLRSGSISDLHSDDSEKETRGLRERVRGFRTDSEE